MRRAGEEIGVECRHRSGLACRRRESLVLQRPQIGETPRLVATGREAESLEARESLAALLGQRSGRRKSRAIRRCFWFRATHVGHWGNSGRGVAEHGVAALLQLSGEALIA